MLITLERAHRILRASHRCSSTLSPMSEFYKGKNILITGSTGFIGKALLEKILWSFADVGRIFVLIRDKRSVKFDDRLEQVFWKEPIFSQYKRFHCSKFSKVVPIEGHLGDNGLKISEKDRRTLKEQVNIVFHSASALHFNDPLDVAMKNIFIGTKAMLSLADDMQHLSSFVYVSTAYSNSHQQTSDEVVYEMNINGDQIMSLFEGNTSKENVEAMVREKYFSGRANTYVFSKAVTENYIQKNYRNLPVTIARPSIVTGALSEPVPGYCDSPSGATFGMIYQGLGLWRYAPHTDTAYADFVPVDIVVNSLLIVAREVALQTIPVQNVYNVTSTSHWPITFKEFADKQVKAFIRSPPANALRPFTHQTKELSLIQQNMRKFFSELPYAIVAQAISNIKWKKSHVLNTTKKIQSIRDDHFIFYRRSFYFPRKNMDTAFFRLSREDQQLFPAIPVVPNNDEYFYNYWMSVRELLLGESADNICEARRHQKRLKIRSRALSLVIAGTFVMSICFYLQ